jgi:hypothetical protein
MKALLQKLDDSQTSDNEEPNLFISSCSNCIHREQIQLTGSGFIKVEVCLLLSIYDQRLMSSPCSTFLTSFNKIFIGTVVLLHRVPLQSLTTAKRNIDHVRDFRNTAPKKANICFPNLASSKIIKIRCYVT